MASLMVRTKPRGEVHLSYRLGHRDHHGGNRRPSGRGGFDGCRGVRIGQLAARHRKRRPTPRGSRAQRRPAGELRELAGIYERRGLSKALAGEVAVALSRDGGLEAHARDELGLDDERRARPLQAAGASALSFACGGGNAVDRRWGDFRIVSGARVHCRDALGTRRTWRVGCSSRGRSAAASDGSRALLGSCRNDDHLRDRRSCRHRRLAVLGSAQQGAGKGSPVGTGRGARVGSLGPGRPGSSCGKAAG